MLGLGLGLGLNGGIRSLAAYVRSIFRLGQDVGWHWQFDNPLTYVGPTYMYQDTAGTTPVTAVGQGIGLLLGREYGGVRGVERVTNGSFGSNVTGWTHNGSGSIAWSASDGGVAVVTTGGVTHTGIYQVIHGLVVGKTYEATCRVKAGTYTGQIALGMDGIGWGTLRTNPTSFIDSRMVFVATGTSIGVKVVQYNNASTGETFSVDSISVREIPGTHLTQATGTAKPTLSARVNVLRSTEALTNATDWTVGGSGAVTSGFSDPNGGTTAFRIVTSTSAINSGIYQGGLTITNRSQCESVCLRGAVGGEQVQIGDATFRTTVTLTTSWQRFTVASTKVSAFFVIYSNSLAQTWYACHPDSRTADDAAKLIPAYQRVGATATDHDTDGFPHYALADGTDDCWASVATVDGSYTDKVSFVAAVTKLSDAADGTILAFGDPSAGDNGSFIMQAPGSSAVTKIQFSSRGTTQAVPFTASTTYNAPITMVAGAVAYIGAPLAQLSINGLAVSTITTTQGTGNYNSAKSISVGQRIGGTARLNGRFYGSTGRFGPMSDSERNNLTRWWQKRIGTA